MLGRTGSSCSAARSSPPMPWRRSMRLAHEGQVQAQHPNYKLTADYDKRNYFDVVKFLSHNLILKADDEYQVIDVTE